MTNHMRKQLPYRWLWQFVTMCAITYRCVPLAEKYVG